MLRQRAKSQSGVFHERGPNHSVGNFKSAFHGVRSAEPENAGIAREMGQTTGCEPCRNNRMQHFMGNQSNHRMRAFNRMRAFHVRSAEPQDAGTARDRPNHRMRRDFTGWAIS